MKYPLKKLKKAKFIFSHIYKSCLAEIFIRWSGKKQDEQQLEALLDLGVSLRVKITKCQSKIKIYNENGRKNLENASCFIDVKMWPIAILVKSNLQQWRSTKVSEEFFSLFKIWQKKAWDLWTNKDVYRWRYQICKSQKKRLKKSQDDTTQMSHIFLKVYPPKNTKYLQVFVRITEEIECFNFEL